MDYDFSIRMGGGSIHSLTVSKGRFIVTLLELSCMLSMTAESLNRQEVAKGDSKKIQWRTAGVKRLSHQGSP